MSIEINGDDEVDMIAWYDKQRVPILSAFAILGVTAMISNYHHRNIRGDESDLIKSAAFIAPLVVLDILAILFRAKWVQWVTAITGLIAMAVFIGTTGTFS